MNETKMSVANATTTTPTNPETTVTTTPDEANVKLATRCVQRVEAEEEEAKASYREVAEVMMAKVRERLDAVPTGSTAFEAEVIDQKIRVVVWEYVYRDGRWVRGSSVGVTTVGFGEQILSEFDTLALEEGFKLFRVERPGLTKVHSYRVPDAE